MILTANQPTQRETTLPFTVCVVSAREETRARLLDLLPLGNACVTLLPPAVWEDGDLEPQSPDLFIVDVGRDVRAAAHAVQQARRRWPSVTILCLYAASSEDAVAMMDAGADDAITADAPWTVLGAHVAASVRRVQLSNAQLRIAFGDLVYDRESRRVWCAGREVQLTPRELRLFDILFLRAGAPVSAETLYDYVWREEGTHTSNSLAVYVGYLRRKLTGSRVAVVETLRGQGYRLSQREP
ncbi:MAG: winged helix-turn-helix domain-containing protein [Gemmatimonadaceae bacterium]